MEVEQEDVEEEGAAEETGEVEEEDVHEDSYDVEASEHEPAEPAEHHRPILDDESVLSVSLIHLACDHSSTEHTTQYVDPAELLPRPTTPPRTPSSVEHMQDVEVESEEHEAPPAAVVRSSTLVCSRRSTLFQPAVDWHHTELVPNAYLESVGLTATSWGSLCCLSCGVAFAPDAMLSHLKKNAAHKDDKTAVDAACFQAALDVCNIRPMLPSAPTTLVPPVSGLALCRGVACGLCPMVASTETSLLVHYRAAHKKAADRRSYEACFMQRFNNSAGASSSWFKVQHVENATEERTVLEAFLADAEQRLGKTVYDPSTSNDPRTVAPWLLSTGWHKEVQDHDPKLLCITVTAAKEFKGLREATQQWIASLSDLQETVLKHIRKRINTEGHGEL